MYRRHILGAIVGLVLLAPAAKAQAAGGAVRPKAHKAAMHRETEADLMKLATVSKDSAQAIALAAVPGGTVTSSEIEREKKHVVYSFDISTDGKSGVDEVQVDAKTGKVLRMKHESPKKERKEARKEAKEKGTAKP